MKKIRNLSSKVTYISTKYGNLKKFLYMGSQWMIYLNSNNDNVIDIRKVTRLGFRHLSEYVSFDSFYEYTNEDFCLFD